MDCLLVCWHCAAIAVPRSWLWQQWRLQTLAEFTSETAIFLSSLKHIQLLLSYVSTCSRGETFSSTVGVDRIIDVLSRYWFVLGSPALIPLDHLPKACVCFIHTPPIYGLQFTRPPFTTAQYNAFRVLSIVMWLGSTLLTRIQPKYHVYTQLNPRNFKSHVTCITNLDITSYIFDVWSLEPDPPRISLSLSLKRRLREKYTKKLTVAFRARNIKSAYILAMYHCRWIPA